MKPERKQKAIEYEQPMTDAAPRADLTGFQNLSGLTTPRALPDGRKQA